MKHVSTKFKWLLLAIVAVLSLPTMAAIDGEGKYFTQDFEDQSTFPTSEQGKETNVELEFAIDGQGTWIFYNSYSATNTSYTSGGTGMNLRMPKNGSYVISPVLENGVSKVTFYIGRASVKVFTSSDGGNTWASVETTTTGKIVTATINSETVNRIKITNDASKDADIDDLSIYAQTFDQPVKVSTGEAANITKTTATVSGSIVKAEQTISEVGFVWSSTNKEPTLADNSIVATVTDTNFSADLSELAEGKTIFYRAYAKYGETQTYGTIMSFKTEAGEQQQTVDSEGRYFIQDFEDQSTFPDVSGKDANTELTFQAFGGEWIYYNSYVSTNSSYNVNGSTQNLRLPKNGTYVITPVLNSGVKKVTWNQMRKTCVAYTSKDGGKTWTSATFEGGTDGALCTLTVEDLQVNRIKIANEASGDADIDNLIVYAQAYGTPAVVVTGNVESITKNSAIVFGSIVDPGDQPITEKGILWSTTNTQPSLADNKEEGEDLTSNDITAAITGLKAQTTVYYCAYALSNAGYAFGEVKSFQTAPATPAVVATSDLTKSGKKFRIGGTVTDDGGADIVEVGVIYSTTPGLDINNGTKIVIERPTAKFAASVELEASTTYYVRAYAITTYNSEPVYGEEKTFTTEEAVEIPDEIKGDEIFCSPDGDDSTADGSEAKPFYDLQKAVDIAQPGDRIWMKAGTYVYNKRINVNDRNGEPDKFIEVFVYPKDSKAHAVLDFSDMPYHGHSDNPQQGIRHTSSYWHYYKIDICNASDNGMLIERNKPTGGSASDIINRTQDGHDNIIEQCNFYKNGDTGLQMKNLAANNYVINCDAYFNCDEGEGDADGFAPKLSVGDGNYFYGCRAWVNSDDGWDVFYKQEGGFGDNMSIILDNCISYKNGFTDFEKVCGGNGNGFKCGSNQGAMNVYLNRCLAVCNKSKGFDQNHNAGDIILNNCTGMSLTQYGDKPYSYRIYEGISSGHVVQLTNCIAINDNARTDKDPSKASEHGKQSQYGRFEVDETLTGLTATTCEFQKAYPEYFIDVTNHAELIGERDDDGEIPYTTFAKLKDDPTNPLIAAGTPITATSYRGIDLAAIRDRFNIDMSAAAKPSLGAYEVDSNAPTGIGRIEYTESNGKAVRLLQCQSGMVIISVNGAKAADEFQVTAFDVTGKTLGQHKFNATSTMFLPNVQGVIILKVTGNGVNESIKVVMK